MIFSEAAKELEYEELSVELNTKTTNNKKHKL
jgi:hypothetical protein